MKNLIAAGSLLVVTTFARGDDSIIPETIVTSLAQDSISLPHALPRLEIPEQKTSQTSCVSIANLCAVLPEHISITVGTSFGVATATVSSGNIGPTWHGGVVQKK